MVETLDRLLQRRDRVNDNLLQITQALSVWIMDPKRLKRHESYANTGCIRRVAEEEGVSAVAVWKTVSKKSPDNRLEELGIWTQQIPEIVDLLQELQEINGEINDYEKNQTYPNPPSVYEWASE